MSYNFDPNSSHLMHITDDYDHPIDLFEKWLKEAEENDELGWVKVMTIAAVHEKTGVLNRNVLLRKFDQSGFIFVTERNSRKYKDLKDNPSIAATFLWKYRIGDNVTLKQVRINGTVSELPPEQISKFYAGEGLSSRIRCEISTCGQPCNWDELKQRHDEVLENVKNGTQKLEQNENYTALLIIPQQLDFYYSSPNCIADRLVYTKNKDGIWSHQRVYA